MLVLIEAALVSHAKNGRAPFAGALTHTGAEWLTELHAMGYEIAPIASGLLYEPAKRA